MNNYSIAKRENRQRTPGMFEVGKERGETLAALVKRFRVEQKIDPTIPITYAGRLDPMAEGIVILLTGDACKEKNKYSSLSKTYEFTVLFGVSTDTYDVLGKITDVKLPIEKTLREEEIKVAIQKASQSPLLYPPYSSKPFEGKPLFMHAREGTLPSVLPLQNSTVVSIDLVSMKEETFSHLVEGIVSDIQKVEGDFRQDEIISKWIDIGKKYGATPVTLVSIRATVASGTYIRSIAHEIGKILGIPALAYSITRTEINF